MMGDTKRSFVPGDEWLYYKIYSGPKTADMVLTQVVQPVAEALLENGVIDHWFFIRYRDPKLHLRVRFHIKDANRQSEVLNAMGGLLGDYMAKDLIWKVQMDTYQREIERYGARSIDLCELIFFEDSKMIASLVDLTEGNEGEELKWLFSMRATDELLELATFTEEGKLHLMESMKESFANEHNMDRNLKKQLDSLYRSKRHNIDTFMKMTVTNNDELAPLLYILEEKSAALRPVMQEVVRRYKDKELEMPIDDLMRSLIHMLMNRIFRDRNRLHEMVLYDFLYRSYKSDWARKKYQKKEKERVEA